MRLLDKLVEIKDDILYGRQAQAHRVTNIQGGLPEDYDDNRQYISNDQYLDAQYRQADDDDDYNVAPRDGKHYTFEQLLEIEGVNIGTAHDSFWRWAARTVAYLGSIGVWFIIGYGNAMVFTGFQGWQQNPPMFLFGFLAEAIVMAVLFKAVLLWREKKTSEAWIATVSAVVLALISFGIQCLFVFGSASKGEYDFFTRIFIQMGVGIPVNWVLYGRAAFFSLASVALVLILPDKKMDIKGALKKQEEEEAALSELYIGRAMLEQRKNVADTMTRLLKQQNVGFGNVANVLTKGHDVYVQHSEPRLVVEHAAKKEIDAPKRAASQQQQSRALTQRPQQQRSPKPLEMQSRQQPVSTAVNKPEPQTTSTSFGKFSDEQMLRQAKRLVSQNPGFTDDDVKAVAKQTGISEDTVVFWVMKAKEELRLEKQAVANGSHANVQQLQRDMLATAKTATMPDASAVYGEVDLGDVDDEPSPLAE